MTTAEGTYRYVIEDAMLVDDDALEAAGLSVGLPPGELGAGLCKAIKLVEVQVLGVPTAVRGSKSRGNRARALCGK